ncbi:IclR family transcriptional regulator [Alteribacillus iranensis]|uniref:DNA-binding transcriptional regulator, IclR family n=1 Tax=Alteribacillus iranensis TaxID=930128 RepID=A0A1I2BCT6_9BACI|nr:IclR family transcriptional regulator [Alteribacillus iranensis]SFE53916.1 DNA-binding transcriptional regulator, IclR family [Alteribacillus iranensis]
MDQRVLKTKGIQSLERAVYILEEIKNNRAPITLTELSHKTSMSKSSLQKYLVSFLKLDMLHYDEATRTYSLGSKLIDLGLNALNRIDIISIIDPFLLKIKEELNQSSILALWTEQGPIIVKYQSSGRSINVEIEIGYRPPLLVSSVGKCFAAFLPDEVTKNLVDIEISSYQLEEEAIVKELTAIREKGFATRESQFGDLPGNQTIACPVFDHTGKAVAVIGLIGFTHDFNTASDSTEVVKLKEISRNVSELLAHQI